MADLIKFTNIKLSPSGGALTESRASSVTEKVQSIKCINCLDISLRAVLKALPLTGGDDWMFICRLFAVHDLTDAPENAR